LPDCLVAQLPRNKVGLDKGEGNGDNLIGHIRARGYPRADLGRKSREGHTPSQESCLPS
jgi:hypothetical protein